MTGFSGSDPLGRFTGLADVYARCRPNYPAAALDFIFDHCGLGSDTLLVDVGCGTGISSRLFARRGVPVVGIEPNDDMRCRAEQEPVPPGLPVPSYRKGRAEATSLPDASAAAVLAAQAFHWFEPAPTLAEFHRILRPAGWAILMWNERDEADPFTAAYGVVVRTAPEGSRLEMVRGRAGEPLLESPLFHQGQRVRFVHEQILDEEGLLGRAFSTSYAPRQPAAAEHYAAAMRDVFARFQRDGRVALSYETSVYVAQKPV